MKKMLTVCLCIAVVFSMCLGTSADVFAKKSIGKDDPKPHIVVPDNPVDDDNSGGGEQPVITEPEKNRYENEGLKKVIDKSKTEDVSPSDIFDMIPQINPDKQDVRNFPVEGSDNLKINLKLYERITELMDIGVMKNGSLSFKMTGDGKNVTIQSDATIGLKESDFLMMVIDPKTGEIYLLTPKDFDPVTGTFKVKLPIYGTFTLIKKLPIVVRDIHPEEYLNEDVTVAVEKLPKKDYIEFENCLDAFGMDAGRLDLDEENHKKIPSSLESLNPISEVYAGTKVKTANFLSANYLADIAVRSSKDTFRYNLSEGIWADLFQDINECDWQRVLDYAGVEYDAKAIKKDPLKLTKIKPFVLKDSFVYHVDADTGEVNIAKEPIISFDVLDEYTDITNEGNGKKFEQDINVKNNKKSKDKVVIDKTQDGTSLLENLDIVDAAYAEIDKDKLTKKEKDILTWDVEDVDEKNTDNLCMIMSSDQYKGMGPFLLYLPKDGKSPNGFNWWWLLLIIPVLIAAYIIYRKNRNRKAA